MGKIEYENLIVNRLKDYIHKTAFNLISTIQKKLRKIIFIIQWQIEIN